MGREIELKLALSREALARLLDSNLVERFDGTLSGPARLRSVYYDTPEQGLARDGISFRIRSGTGRIVQTVKTPPAIESLAADRGEWEWALNQARPALDLLGDPPLKDIAKRARKEGLHPAFETVIDRRIALLSHRGATVELAADTGRIATRTGARAALEVCEVELELKSGGVAALYAIAREIVDGWEARVVLASKSERAYALLRGVPQSVPVRAGKVELPRDIDARAALASIVGHGLKHLAGNVVSVVDNRQPEGVHQMRVALRRLRAALALVNGSGAPLVEALKSECVWLADELAPARDLDVFVTETVKQAFAERRNTASAALRRAVAPRRKAGWERAVAAALSTRAQHLMLDLAALTETASFVEAKDGGAEDPLAVKARTFARNILDRRLKKVAKFAKRIEQLDIAERHQMRIALKKLRYAAEFFESLFSDRKVDASLKSLSRLQDVFGALNDAASGESLLNDIVAAASPRARPALEKAQAYMTGWLAGRAALLWDEAQARWRKYEALDPFWR